MTDLKTHYFNVKHEKKYHKWGWIMNYEGLYSSEYKLNKLCVYPHSKIPLQKTSNISKHWVIIKGSGIVKINNKDININNNQHICILDNTDFELENINNEVIEIIETQIYH